MLRKQYVNEAIHDQAARCLWCGAPLRKDRMFEVGHLESVKLLCSGSCVRQYLDAKYGMEGGI